MSELDDLIRKKAEALRAEAKANHIDWEARKAWWQRKLEELFDQIYDWFRDVIDDETIEFKKELINLQEEQLGSYQSLKLTLSIGLSDFEIIPVGSVIVGGFGRVDLSGPNGRAMLILAGEKNSLSLEERQATAQWYLVNREDRLKLTPLTEETFKQVFADLI